MKHYFSVRNLTVLGLALMSSILVYLQATRALPLVDFTYQVETAYRLGLGQMPYVDFDLVLTPGTYYLMKIVSSLFGSQYIYQIVLVAFTQLLTVVLTYKILMNFSGSYWLILPICVVVALCGFVIYPHPSYDNFSIFFIILSICYMQAIFSEDAGPPHFFLLGVSIFLPFIFKQNVGAVFVVGMLFTLGCFIRFSRKEDKWRCISSMFFGATVSAISFIIWLDNSNAVTVFYDQVFVHAGKTRNVFDQAYAVIKSYILPVYLPFYFPVLSISLVLWVAKNTEKLNSRNGYLKYVVEFLSRYILLGSLVVTFILTPAIAYLASEKFRNIFNQSWQHYYSGIWPFIIVVSVICLVINVRLGSFKEKPFETLLPIPIILVLNAAFLSQGFYGSTYSLWPLWAILFLIAYNSLKKTKSIRHLDAGAIFIIFCLIFVHGVDNYRNSRLLFVDLTGKLESSNHSYLTNLSTPGAWLRDLDKIVEFVRLEIPEEDKFISIPGEDPLHFLTDRVQPLRYFQFNEVTLLPSLSAVKVHILQNNVRWLLVKPLTQAPAAYIDYEPLLKTLGDEFLKYKSIGGYDIYKKVD
jgi:hypothetical protein